MGICERFSGYPFRQTVGYTYCLLKKNVNDLKEFVFIFGVFELLMSVMKGGTLSTTPYTLTTIPFCVRHMIRV